MGGLDHFGGDAFQTLLNQHFQRLTFGFARDDKVIQWCHPTPREFQLQSRRDLAPGLPSRPASVEYQPG